MSTVTGRNPVHAPGRDPVAQADRIEVLDALRGFALFGILVINMRSFTGWAFMSGDQQAALLLPFDGVTLFLHEALFRGKFYTLFSLLFGVGFALQLSRAGTRGNGDFITLYRRRLFVLLGLGIVHMTLLWEGDILALYALCGFALLPFRDCSDRKLLAWAAVCVLLPVPLHALALASGGTFDPGGFFTGLGEAAWTALGYHEDDAFRLLAEGGWREIVHFNITGPPYRVGSLLAEWRPLKVLGIFLIGLWTGRRLVAGRLLDDASLLRRVLIAGLALGVPTSLWFAYLHTQPEAGAALVTTVASALSVAPLGLAYAAGFALLWRGRHWRPALGAFAPAGRVALSTYLSQTLIGISFYGIGFGLVGRVGPSLWTLLALTIFTLQVLLATLWLRYFRFGPAEWVWRRLTYGMPLPLRRLPAGRGSRERELA